MIEWCDNIIRYALLLPSCDREHQVRFNVHKQILWKSQEIHPVICCKTCNGRNAELQTHQHSASVREALVQLLESDADCSCRLHAQQTIALVTQMQVEAESGQGKTSE